MADNDGVNVQTAFTAADYEGVLKSPEEFLNDLRILISSVVQHVDPVLNGLIDVVPSSRELAEQSERYTVEDGFAPIGSTLFTVPLAGCASDGEEPALNVAVYGGVRTDQFPDPNISVVFSLSNPDKFPLLQSQLSEVKEVLSYCFGRGLMNGAVLLGAKGITDERIDDFLNDYPDLLQDMRAEQAEQVELAIRENVPL